MKMHQPAPVRQPKSSTCMSYPDTTVPLHRQRHCMCLHRQIHHRGRQGKGYVLQGSVQG